MVSGSSACEGTPSPPTCPVRPRAFHRAEGACEGEIDVQALYTYRRTAQATLADVHAGPERLLLEVAPREAPRSFRITLRRRLGRVGGRGGRDSVIDQTRQQVVDFYRDVVQGITPWRPSPARLPRGASSAAEDDLPDALVPSDPIHLEPAEGNGPSPLAGG